MRMEPRSLALCSLLALVACSDDVPPTADGSGSSAGTTSPGDTSSSTAVVDDGSTSSTGPGTADDTTTDDGGPIDPADLEWPLLDCDPLAPGYCAYPFPSNVYTIPDDGMVTGRRLQIPVSMYTADPNPEPWTWGDGFSPSGAIMTFMPGATATGLPGHEDIDASLADGSPTVLVDAETYERIPHFSELDWSTSDASRRSLFIHPVSRLLPGRRYIVAIRSVVDGSGAALPPSPAFAALRDGTPLPEEPSVEERRVLYGDIFWRLGQAGVARGELQLAWDFHTASDENTTGWLLHMRDDAFAQLGEDSPPYTIDVVDTDWNTADFLYRIEGTMTVPRYVDTSSPVGARLVRDGNGMPVQDGTLDVPFWMIVPRTAEQFPAALVQHGHGLLGAGSQVQGGHFRAMATTYNYVIFGVSWIGMASEDYLPIAAAVTSRAPGGLATMTDRLHQGALNQLLAMRMASVGLANDPLLAGLLDPNERYYYGISQGGILGGVYMATTTEVTRGVLDVPGQPYNLLLTRSVDFNDFFTLLRTTYSDPVDIAYLLGTLQLMWDRVEPTGYTHRIVQNPLPGTGTHDILVTAALGDHQVTTLGAHHMARSAGIGHLDTGLRDLWGLPAFTNGSVGSAYVEYDFGLPPDPVCNLPQTACDDPHGKLRQQTAAREQINEFLRTGAISNFCTNGVCSYPELSGCDPGEGTPNVCG
jgi:hypothetical protein